MTFYLPQAQAAASGPVLEIGCGTTGDDPAGSGQVDITGLDVSASMLEALRKAESQGLASTVLRLTAAASISAASR